MRRFAREQYEYRALGYNVDDGVVYRQEKGPWRSRKDQAIEDAKEIDRQYVVVQKIRIGITKVLETVIVKEPIPNPKK
jgi:hypothetical protein